MPGGAARDADAASVRGHSLAQCPFERRAETEARAGTASRDALKLEGALLDIMLGAAADSKCFRACGGHRDSAL